MTFPFTYVPPPAEPRLAPDKQVVPSVFLHPSMFFLRHHSYRASSYYPFFLLLFFFRNDENTYFFSFLSFFRGKKKLVGSYKLYYRCIYICWNTNKSVKWDSKTSKMLKTQIVKSSKLCLLEKLILQKLSFVDIKFGRLKFWKIFITRKYNHTNFEKLAR